MIYISESTPTERAALVAFWLAQGRELTTVEVAESLQVSQRTAQRLFTAVSRSIPCYRNDDGRWCIVGDVAEISPY